MRDICAPIRARANLCLQTALIVFTTMVCAWAGTGQAQPFGTDPADELCAQAVIRETALGIAQKYYRAETLDGDDVAEALTQAFNAFFKQRGAAKTWLLDNDSQMRLFLGDNPGLRSEVVHAAKNPKLTIGWIRGYGRARDSDDFRCRAELIADLYLPEKERTVQGPGNTKLTIPAKAIEVEDIRRPIVLTVTFDRFGQGQINIDGLDGRN